MAIIQPFRFQYCTAFHERKQIADKLNQVIDQTNTNTDDIIALDDDINGEFKICQSFEQFQTMISEEDGKFTGLKNLMSCLKINEEHGDTEYFTFFHPKNTPYYRDHFAWLNSNPYDQDPWDMWY